MTGTGEIVDASRDENSELFWGIQGAGFNYGIVTSAVYSIYNATNSGQLLNADMAFPASANGSVWDIVSSFAGSQPKELSFDISALYLAAAAGVSHLRHFTSSSNSTQTLISVSATYYGPDAQGLALLQPLINLKPVLQNISYVAWKDAQAVAHFSTNKENFIRGSNYNIYGINLYESNPSTLISVFDNFNDFFNSYPQYHGSILVISQFPTVVAQSITDNATAYPYRNVLAYS